MKRYAWLAAVVMICLCFACLVFWRDTDAPMAPAVSVDRKGQISAWFVEGFDEDYYSLRELTEMAEREAAEYNARIPGKKAAVKVEKVEMLPDDSGRIRVNYRYDSWESYTDFNGQGFFYGTVEEAAAAGYSADAVLESVADGRLWAEGWLSLSAGGGTAARPGDDMLWEGERLSLPAGSRVIITDVKADIYCPGEVTHISGDASVNEDGSIDTSKAEGTVCILMK